VRLGTASLSVVILFFSAACFYSLRQESRSKAGLILCRCSTASGLVARGPTFRKLNFIRIKARVSFAIMALLEGHAQDSFLI
jgi:hypothetical protein